MHILFVTSHLRKGGPVSIIYNLCRELRSKPDVELSLMTLRKEGAASKLQDFECLGIKVIQLNHSYLFCECCTALLTKEIQQRVDEMHVDIVHCHGYHAVITCKGIKHAKVIATLHNRASEDFLNVFGPLVGRYMLRRYYVALTKFDANIAVSESTAEAYRGKVPNLSFVNNGIDTSTFHPLSSEERHELRIKLNIPSNSHVFVTSGRIEKEKRMEELVAWFKTLQPSQNTILYVLGDGSRLQACKELAAGYENIRFTGRISNVKMYLQASDYYISYSRSEGMSLAVCEGIACGLFPVLSDIPSHHDAVDSIGGIYFKEFQGLYLNTILKVKWNSNEFFRYINDNFSIPSMVSGYMYLYQRLISTDK